MTEEKEDVHLKMEFQEKSLWAKTNCCLKLGEKKNLG